MWNVDLSGSSTDVGLAVRQAVIEDSVGDPSLARVARIFGKYLSQLITAYDNNTVHVVTTGSLTTGGAVDVTFACEVS